MVRIACRPVPYARPTRLLLPLALLLGLIAVARTPTYAATITVSCDPVALIAAITTANDDAAADTLSLAPGCTYTLTDADNGDAGLPVISSPITIQGNGATVERSSATGTPAFRLFFVDLGGELTLQAVTVRGGAAANGGGILNVGILTIESSTLSGNSADRGGGINSSGTLTVANSTLTGNSAGRFGGGIGADTGTVTVTTSTFIGNSALDNGGGIDNQSTLTVENSTFSGNSAGEYGGAILNSDTMTVTNSTFSGNSASLASSAGGGGLYDEGDATFGNTILAGNLEGGNCRSESGLTDSGGNLSSDATCGFTVASSQNSVDPLLGPLQDNGGPTETLALLPGSPAIDAAVNCPPPATDQRGITRPQGTACDSGAFEVVVPTPTPTSTPTPTATPTPTSTPTPTATPTLTATPGTTASRGFVPLVLRAPRNAPTATATP